MTDLEYANLLDELIAKYNRETRHLEFKSNYQDPNDLGEYISALSNGATLDNEEYGYLFFGVDDKTLEIKGTTFNPTVKKVSFKLDKSNKTPNQFLELGLRQFIAPKINFEIRSFKSNNGRNVVVFKIPAAKEQPTYFMTKAFVRVDTCKTDLKNYPDWVRQIYNSKRDWSADIIEGATHDDLDAEAIREARLGYYESYPDKKDEAEKWDDVTFLDHARVTINGQITRTALLLLGKETSSHLIGHIAQMVWRLHSAEERAAKVFQPPFLLTAIKLRETIRNYQIKIFPNNALLPAEVWKYDSRTLLEALHNCIMHQDYAMNERIIVQEYVDRLTFINAGRFYEGSYEQYIEGKKTPSMYRNNFLKEAMRTLKMVDTQGFGIHDMFQRQRDRFLPLPDYDKEIQDHVVLNIPGHVINAEYSELLMQDASINLITAYLLDMVQKGKTITKEAAQYLRKKKLIEGRAPHYHITLSLAKKTKQVVHYTKEKGINKTAQIMLILELATNSGEIGFKRKDAYGALKDSLSVSLTEKQKLIYVSHLLIEMHKQGYLEKTDSGKRWKITEKGKKKYNP